MPLYENNCPILALSSTDKTIKKITLKKLHKFKDLDVTWLELLVYILYDIFKFIYLFLPPEVSEVHTFFT